MAPTVSVAQSYGVLFSGKRLRSAIVFEAERGYQNVLGRRMRFNNFLISKMSKICSRSKHKLAEKLLDEVNSYETGTTSHQTRLLNKVSVLMGYDSLHNLFENERIEKQSGISLKEESTVFDASVACKRFPSIIVGSFSQVELYNETTHSEIPNFFAAQSCTGDLTKSDVANLVYPDALCEAKTVCSPCSVLPNGNTSIGEVNSHTLPLSPLLTTLEIEKRTDYQVTEEEKSSTELGLKSAINAASIEPFLDKSVSCIPGLSKRHCNQLETCGFHTLRKLLHHFPRTYADSQNAQIGIDDGQYMISVGRILSSRGVKASYSFSFLEVIVGCEIADNDGDVCKGKKNLYLHLKKFFRGNRFTYQPFLRSLAEKYKEGDLVCVSGKVRTMRQMDHYEMREYNIDVLEDEKDSPLFVAGRPYPIYPSKGGLNPSFLRDMIARALQALPINIDPIPKEITQDFSLLCLHNAYVGIHQPKNFNDADLARKRLIFDEFFYLQLARLFQMLEGLGTQIEKEGLLDKYMKPEQNAAYIEEWSNLTKKFLEALPFSLTPSQLSAVSEIIRDLKRPIPMNRLLQGDVGCGKTVVAFLACMEVIGFGYQAAFMVPTELLAIQHYEHLLSLLEKMEGVQCKPSVALLTGSTPLKQSRMIRESLKTGEISLVIGTHSLISERIEFSALRIAVVDEQHRFGVIQRGRFNSKLYYSSLSSRMEAANLDGSLKGDRHMAPHVLALSATPIPRTLALALYGDMSLTQISDLPPGRIPVETYTIEGNDIGFENVYEMMLQELDTGGKVYIVYPVIEQSEQLPQLHAASADLEAVSCRFKDYSCGLLHGKMKGHEKGEALRRFRSGETHILLATQVIEIGVDVPDASMMVVMNAERFGIAQLHQLRGRVGRGVRKSKCILLASTTTGLNRLKVLQNSSDGFQLANMDLLLRGPGDLLGKKQSGHLPEFPIARLEVDGNMLQEAHLAALKILSVSHDLKQFPELKAELSMRQPLCLLGD